jgi:hypothetical protein
MTLLLLQVDGRRVGWPPHTAAFAAAQRTGGPTTSLSWNPTQPGLSNRLLTERRHGEIRVLTRIVWRDLNVDTVDG